MSEHLLSCVIVRRLRGVRGLVTLARCYVKTTRCLEQSENTLS